MRSKSPKPSWVKPRLGSFHLAATALLALFANAPVANALSITPLYVANQILPNSAQEATMYLLHSTYAGTVAPNYAKYDLTSTSTVFTFLIQGANTSTGYLWVYAEGPSGVTPSYPVPLTGCDYARGQGWGHIAEQRDATGVVAMLLTDGDTRLDWVRAGQALQRTLLCAGGHEVSAAFHSQALEVPELREFIRTRFCDRAHPQMIMRLGIAPAEAARRSVTELTRGEL